MPHIGNEQSPCSFTIKRITPAAPTTMTTIPPSTTTSLIRPSSQSTTVVPTGQTSQSNHSRVTQTQNEFREVQLTIYNNVTRISNSTRTNDSPNWLAATIRFHSNSGLITQQMRPTRGDAELGSRSPSWNDFGRCDANTSNIGDSSSANQLSSTENQLRVDTIQLLISLFNRMFCMNGEDSVRDQTVTNSQEQQNASLQLVPITNRHHTIPDHDSIERIVQAINNTFIRGRRPQPRHPFIEFDGTITEDLANRICWWLRTNYGPNSIIRKVFFNNSLSSINKVHKFLTRCGVETLTFDGLVKIKRDQSFELLLVVTYLLEASGYTHNYLFN